jgi:hypothetical protein
MIFALSDAGMQHVERFVPASRAACMAHGPIERLHLLDRLRL